MIKIPMCDLHTHTTFCDGKNTAEEMALWAISLGLETIGFSGHSPLDIEGTREWCILKEEMGKYRGEILRLKEKYKDKINILFGIEQDSFSAPVDMDFDYKIGSVHYVKKGEKHIAVDLDYTALMREIDECFGGDIMAFVADYYALCANVVEMTRCDIVGHFDLITKFNEKYSYIAEDDKKYRSIALSALDAVMENDVMIEINTGAISRGYRKTPYPSRFILERIAQKGGKVVLNSDSHSTKGLLCAFEDSVEYARSCGVRELWVYRKDGFVPLSI